MKGKATNVLVSKVSSNGGKLESKQKHQHKQNNKISILLILSTKEAGATLHDLSILVQSTRLELLESVLCCKLEDKWWSTILDIIPHLLIMQQKDKARLSPFDNNKGTCV
jgi:hypothetical protein